MRTNVERDAVEADAHERTTTGIGGSEAIAGLRLGGDRMPLLRRLWKRHVTGRPDRYQAYVSFPTDGDRSAFGEVHDCIEELEYVFEGRLDVYARTNGIAAVSDCVPTDQFDGDAFETALERIEDCYAGSHSITRLEKWRSDGDHLVKSFVVVPVKPLFPRESTETTQRVQSAAE